MAFGDVHFHCIASCPNLHPTDPSGSRQAPGSITQCSLNFSYLKAPARPVLSKGWLKMDCLAWQWTTLTRSPLPGSEATPLGCHLSLMANSKPWDTPPGIVMVELQRLPVCCGLDTHTSAEIPRPATPSLQPAYGLTHYQPLHIPQVLGWLHLSHRVHIASRAPLLLPVGPRLSSAVAPLSRGLRTPVIMLRSTRVFGRHLPP
jgi:hypothetical protein